MEGPGQSPSPDEARLSDAARRTSGQKLNPHGKDEKPLPFLSKFFAKRNLRGKGGASRRWAGESFSPAARSSRLLAAYRPKRIMMTICTTSMTMATGTCFLMTPLLSFMSRMATGTMLKLAAMGVMSVPQ